MEGFKEVEQILMDSVDSDSESDTNSNESSLGEDYENNRDYFYANTCHVCYSLDRVGKRLKRCSGCYMISYCGNSHQKKHWQAHKAICKAVQEIISKSGGPSIFGKTKGMDQKTWVKTKLNAMLIITLKLGRCLHSSEKNMFKFPRACAVCHDSDPNALTNCNSCGNSSFCKNHVSDSKHKSLCPFFLSSYSLDRLKKFTNKMEVYDIVSALLHSDAMVYIPSNDKIIKPPSCMRKFLDIYFKKAVNLRRENCRSDYWDMFISECFTRPLTLISAMEKINFEPTSNLTVHILGANDLEFSGLLVWETILHWIPKIQRLKLVLIGPELRRDILFDEVCDRCHIKGKDFVIEIHRTFYHDYMKIPNVYSKPNLVIGYNIGLAEFENPGSAEDTWTPTILSLAKNDVPFILTAYTQTEARADHKRMCLILGNTTNYSCFEKNQFACLRPFRDVETEEIFYENNYIILYEKLPKERSEKDKVKQVVKPVKKENSEAKKENKINSTISEKKNPSKSKSISENNKKLSVPQKEKKIDSSKENKVLTSVSTEKNKSLKPTSDENQKASNAVSAEKKEANSTQKISEPKLEELKKENKLLKEEVERLQSAIEEERKGANITAERKNLIREVENIEETIQREIRELREEVQNVKV